MKKDARLRSGVVRRFILVTGVGERRDGCEGFGFGEFEVVGVVVMVVNFEKGVGKIEVVFGLRFESGEGLGVGWVYGYWWIGWGEGEGVGRRENIVELCACSDALAVRSEVE